MWAVAAAVLVPLCGCSSGVSFLADGDVALVTDAGFLTGDEAAIHGTLIVTEAGCVGIADALGNAYPAIWPRGTTLVTASPVAIEIPGVGRRQVGDPLTGGGGYYASEGRESLAAIATRCAWTGEIIGIRFDRD